MCTDVVSGAVSNSADGGYNPEIAENTDLPEPEWPVVKHFGEVMRAAFKKGGRVVDSLDHSLIERLAGRKL